MVAKGELEDFFHKAFSVNGFHLLVLSHSIRGICGYLCMCQVRVTSESILHYCRTEHHIPLNLSLENAGTFLGSWEQCHSQLT
jgi:hypothetical protein